jgi:uncharacterized protein YeaO (DUF488 family)
MIRITNIDRIIPSKCDSVYLIIRSLKILQKRKHPILSQSVHVPELSPTWGLFRDMLRWKQTGEWNIGTFENNYRPQFLFDLNNNAIAGDWLTQLSADDRAGMMIALGCYCKDENLCHRKIIGEILRNRGCNVVFDKDVMK